MSGGSIYYILPEGVSSIGRTGSFGLQYKGSSPLHPKGFG